MHKIEIEYTDYFNNNEKRTDELYFNINAFELAEIAVDFDEGLGEYMRTALSSGRNKDAFKVLKLLFIRGYGRRKEIDGRWRFIKNPDWIVELLPSPEFEAFYLKLADNTQFATDFWNGLVSEELLKRAKLLQENGEVLPPLSPNTDGKKFRDLSLEEQVALMRQKAAANGLSLDD